MATQNEEVKIKITVDGADKGAKQIEGLEKSMFKASLGADLAARAISGMVGVVGSGVGVIANFAKQGINLAMSFEQQMSSIKALTGATQSELKAVQDLSYQLGEDTVFSALEAAQGIEELLKAGVKLEDIMGGAARGALDLAAAGGLSVAESAEIASTALNAFSKDAITVTQAADILAGAANASATNVQELRFGLSQSAAVAAGAGLSFKDTATALALFAQNGLKGSDAGTSLKTMLLNLQPTTEKQKELFRDLGILTADGSNAFYDASGNIKSMAEIAQVLNTRLKNMTSQERSLTLELMFGTDALRAANILYKEGAKGMNAMGTEMTKFTAADVAAEKVNNLAGTIDFLKSTIETKLIKVFTPLLTIFNRFIKEGLQYLGNTFKLIKPDLDSVSSSLGQLGTILVEAGIASEVKNIGSELGKSFTQFIIDRVQFLAKRLRELVEYLKTPEGKQALQDFKETLRTIGDQLLRGIDLISKMITMIEKLQPAVDKVVGAYQDISGAYNTVSAVSNPVASSNGALPWLKSKLGFASGTMSAPGGLAMVGERGPELMNVPKGSRVSSNSETMNTLVSAMMQAMQKMQSNKSVNFNAPISFGGGRAPMQQMDIFSKLLTGAI